MNGQTGCANTTLGLDILLIENFSEVRDTDTPILSLKTCFLIDDDEDDRDIFELALQQLGPKFTCVTSESCSEALETLKKGELNPDFIFLDLNMPLVSGRECLSEIRKLSKFQNTPVVIYTTSSVPKDKEDVMRLGATSFITKPNKISILKDVLREVLNS